MKLLVIAGLFTAFVGQSQARTGSIPADAKIYVDPASGFDTFLTAEIQRRHVPLTITTSKGAADFELQAVTGGQKVSGADWKSRWLRGYGEAEIRLVDIRTGEIVFTSAFNRNMSLHDWRTAAEACVGRLNSGVNRAESEWPSGAHPTLDF
jgi:hypothetical protein